MSKAYHSLKPTSNQNYRFQDLIRELDTQAPGQQIRKQEILNQGHGKPGPTTHAHEFTMPVHSKDFKEFDFLKNKKPNGTTIKKDSKGSKRDVSAPKFASTRDAATRTRTMERLTSKPKENTPVSAKTPNKMQSQRMPVQPIGRPIAKPIHRPEPKKQIQSAREQMMFTKPVLPIKIESRPNQQYKHQYNSYSSDDDLEPLAEQINRKQPSLPRHENDTHAEPMFGFTSSYKTVQPFTAKSETAPRMKEDDWKDILMEGRESLPDLLTLIKNKNTNLKTNHQEEDATKKRHAETNAFKSKRTIQQSLYERNREFLQRRKEHIKQIEREISASFRPKINKKSVLIDKMRRGRDASPRYESLHALDGVLRECKEELKETIEQERFEKFYKEELENCTFRPKINSMQSISPARNYQSVSERGGQWRQKTKQKVQNMARIAEIEELKDCTFKPNFLNKF